MNTTNGIHITILDDFAVQMWEIYGVTERKNAFHLSNFRGTFRGSTLAANEAIKGKEYIGYFLRIRKCVT